MKPWTIGRKMSKLCERIGANSIFRKIKKRNFRIISLQMKKKLIQKMIIIKQEKQGRIKKCHQTRKIRELIHKFPIRYSFDQSQIRLELIELIEKQNYPLSVAGDLLGIKLSTAKLIMSKYKSKGYVTKYKREKANEQLKTKRKQKKAPQTSLVQQQQKPTENTVKDPQQPMKVPNEPIQQVVSFEAQHLAFMPYYQFPIPVYFGWTLPQ